MLYMHYRNRYTKQLNQKNDSFMDIFLTPKNTNAQGNVLNLNIPMDFPMILHERLGQPLILEWFNLK